MSDLFESVTYRQGSEYAWRHICDHETAAAEITRAIERLLLEQNRCFRRWVTFSRENMPSPRTGNPLTHFKVVAHCPPGEPNIADVVLPEVLP